MPRSGKEPPGLVRLAIRRRILTVAQLQDVRRLRLAIRHGIGLDYDLGQVLFERVFASNPRMRALLVRPDGVRELLGADVETSFWKFPRSGHDRFMERVRRDEVVGPVRMHEAKDIQRELARHGILRRAGEILVDAGWVDRELAQEYLRPAPELENLPTLAFARIAVTNGFVAEREATDALELADAIDEDVGIRLPIGQIFLLLGHLRRGEVEAILEAQAGVGRIPREATRLRVLELSEPEEDVLTARLLEAGAIAEADVDGAVDVASRLAEYGLELGALEVLWLQDRLPPAAIEDVVRHRDASLARLEPEPPAISLSIAPSAGSIAGQGPSDLSEADFLFGQFAVLAGAVVRPELERAVTIYRRCRKELGLELTLGQVLFERHRREPRRLHLLVRAQRELSEYLGWPYDVPLARFGPLEIEVAEERLARSTDPAVLGEIEQAIRTSRILGDLGIERHAVDLLFGTGGAARRAMGDLAAGGRERDRRLVGGWRPRARGSAAAKSLFEKAISTSLSTPGWGRGHIGNLALEQGLLEPGQLVEALYVQLRTREIGMVKPFGEILVELGYLTTRSLADLLKIQEERVEEIREEAGEPEAPPDLEGEDEVLYLRIRATGALDEERLRQAFRISSQMRSLGLSGSLTEVHLRRGDLDEEIVLGLLREAEREERLREEERTRGLRRRRDTLITSRFDIQRAYRDAVVESSRGPREEALRRVLRARARPGRRIGRRGALVAAAVALLLAGAGTAAVLRSTGTRETFLLVNEGSRGGAWEGDAEVFADAMRREGFVLVGGRWVPERIALAPPEDRPATTVDDRRRTFAARMRREGYLEVPGAWLRSDAFTRLAESRERGEAGFVRLAGRWRPAGVAAERAAVRPDRREGAIDGFEAALRVDAERTRVGVRFDSRLPEEASYALVVSSAGEGGRVLHAVVFHPGRSGLVQVEVEPIPRPLPRGTYLVELVYRPEDQPALVARAAGIPFAASGEFDLVSSQPVASESTEGWERALVALEERLVRLEDEPGVRLAAWAEGEDEVVGRILADLLSSARLEASPAHAGVRDRLISAARRLRTILSRAAAGSALEPGSLGAVRRELEEARRLLPATGGG